jgi:hypothetical protein
MMLKNGRNNISFQLPVASLQLLADWITGNWKLETGNWKLPITT